MSSGRKRANHEGSIFKRGGRWVACVTFPDGSRPERTAKTQREARLKLEELKELAAGNRRLPAAEEKTVGDYMQGWLTRSQRLWSHNSYVNYSGYCKNHILPYRISGVNLETLTDRDIEYWIGDLEKREVGSRTMQGCFQMLRRVMEDARKRRILARNPMEFVESPRQKRKPISPPEGSDIVLFLDAAKEDPRIATLAIVLVYTGMRIGEALALTWRDYESKGGRLAIKKSLSQRRGRLGPSEKAHEIRLPKTKAGKRDIGIPSAVVDALDAHRLAIGALTHSDRPIFANERGGYLRQSNLLRRHWHPACDRAELPRKGFHAFRHAHASMLLSNEVSYAAVAARLGHSDPSVTLGTYAHTVKGDDANAVERLKESMSNARLEAVAGRVAGIPN